VRPDDSRRSAATAIALLVAYTPSLFISLVIYLFPPEIAGREDFVVRLVVALAASVLIGVAAAPQASRLGEAIARFALSVLAAGTPPLVFLGGLTIACCDKPDCLA
jgi:hypothetical protein